MKRTLSVISLALVICLSMLACDNSQKYQSEAMAQATSRMIKKPVIYCGAPTKNGAACRRRVKKAGDRCWQHKKISSTGNKVNTEITATHTDL